MRKKSIGLVVCLLGLVGGLPAIAQVVQGLGEFGEYATDMRNYLTNNISDFRPWETQTQTAINNSSGAVNIPNPNTAGKNARGQMTQYSLSDKFENNSAVRGEMVSNEIDRQITRASVEGVLGTNGQNRLREKLQNNEANMTRINQDIQEISQQVNQSINQAANCLNLPIPDPSRPNVNLNLECIKVDLLKSISQLESRNLDLQKQQLDMANDTMLATIQMRQDLQYSNINLTNISEQMDEVNRSQRVNTSAEVARLLRTTSQSDLLVKRN